MKRCFASAERPADDAANGSAKRSAHASLDVEKVCNAAEASITNAITKVHEAHDAVQDERGGAAMASLSWWKMVYKEDIRFQQTLNLLQQAHSCLTRGQDMGKGKSSDCL